MCEDLKAKTKRCGKHSFRLSGKGKTYFKGTTIIDFKPIQKSKKIQKLVIIPKYNNDKKHFTPAFIIPSLPLQNDEILIQEHSKRIKENTTEISEILVPKPRSRQKYCGVCRDYYEEYITHISGDNHRQKLRSSHFQGYIFELTQLFRQETQERQPQLQKLNSLQMSCETVCYSNSEDLVEACLNLQ